LSSLPLGLVFNRQVVTGGNLTSWSRYLRRLVIGWSDTLRKLPRLFSPPLGGRAVTATPRRGGETLVQDITHLLLDCPVSEPLRRAIFGTYFIFYVWSRPWSVARLLGVSANFLHAPIPPKGVR